MHNVSVGISERYSMKLLHLRLRAKLKSSAFAARQVARKPQKTIAAMRQMDRTYKNMKNTLILVMESGMRWKP